MGKQCTETYGTLILDWSEDPLVTPVDSFGDVRSRGGETAGALPRLTGDGVGCAVVHVARGVVPSEPLRRLLRSKVG